MHRTARKEKTKYGVAPQIRRRVESTNKMNISEAIGFAAVRLRDAGIANERREASSLLAFVLGREDVFLIAHPEYELAENEAAAFEKVVSRRALREPFHYIVGRKEFYELEFEVAPGVLIPRPETEILVEAAISIISGTESPVFYEIGVGSGCISISILHNVNTAAAVGVDISDTALSITAKNADRHGVGDRLTLRQADVFDGLSGAFDLMVSNPPYIEDGDFESLQAEVGGFEPHTALLGGPDGLSIVRRIVADASSFLKPHGFLLIEIGYGQAESVKELFDVDMWESVEFLPDLQGISRIVKARILD